LGSKILQNAKRRKEKPRLEYRGIKIHESVNLRNKNGDYNKLIKKGLDQFIDYFKKNNHALLSEYIKSHSKVLIDFKCGHDPHWTYPITYKKGHGCPRCAIETNAEKYSEEAKREFISILEARGHILLSPYKTSHEKVLIDFKCGHEPYLITPDSYKNKNSGCLECCRENMRKRSREKSEKSAEEFTSLVKENGHMLLTPYGKNNMEKVLIDFQCEHEPHWTTPVSYKYGYRCPKCGNLKVTEVKHKKSERLLKRAIKKNNHILLSDYVDVKTKVLIDFQCGHTPHWVTPDSYRHNDSGCPKCSQSKGERIICQWLEKNEIFHENRYILPNKNYLYDIFIPSENLIIEVHGIQHFKEIEFFNMRTLKQEQENDRKKRKYAESLGFKYIEVDYREGIPELTLERFLYKFNQIRKAIKTKPQYEQLCLF
jgi:very-short-patch-repair endonuclease